MSGLRLVRPDPEREPLRLEALLELLGPDKLNAIDAKAKIMRESFTCPYTVRNYDEFKTTLYEFYAHYQNAFYNIDFKQATHDDDYWKQYAYDFAQKHLGSYKGDMRTAERNAIAGRDGGMIAVIDTVTESIIKLHTQIYVHSVFFDLIAPSDYNTRYRLADELLKKYGRFLFPDEELMPYYLLGNNLEEFIQGFVTHIHALRREWRY
jgi:hypothetical protein